MPVLLTLIMKQDEYFMFPCLAFVLSFLVKWCYLGTGIVPCMSSWLNKLRFQNMGLKYITSTILYLYIFIFCNRFFLPQYQCPYQVRYQGKLLYQKEIGGQSEVDTWKLANCNCHCDREIYKINRLNLQIMHLAIKSIYERKQKKGGGSEWADSTS